MAIVKGGVWTNVEDEILKAAISKYGKNQWARISSLLVRKAPKQCKARWYEWLDPGIKKVEWTREEDEKLLHLAKLLPTQWRTIAPIVGRTSTQCLERYQKLLDDAEAAENSELGLSGAGAEGAAPTADSVRKLRAGETDPDPETKPAKPDAIDMDEDEKEMLSEARARLANTQGKKAKRKQREKLLAETKRLSVIQKRRDLKAAGINTKLYFRKKGEMDYNADIPFEHKPALGFYDTTEEAMSNEQERRTVNFRHVEQKRRDEASAADDRKAAMKKRGNDGSSEVLADSSSLDKLRKAEQLTKRRKLNLPGPQVTDQELEEIVKIGHTSNEARELALTDNMNTASEGLLGEYSTIATNQTLRTPRTPASQDNISLEARNLRAMTSTQSSLLGGENTPLHGAQHGTGYGGATPRSGIASTPNPVGRSETGVTPRVESYSAGTPMRTPRRDGLSLNGATHPVAEQELGQMVVHSEAELAKLRAAQLRSQFADLPKPKNDFELQLPDEDPDEAGAQIVDQAEDSAERDARIQRQKDLEEQETALRRSSVLQRGLPRPKFISNLRRVDTRAQMSLAEKLIAEELARLVVSDTIRYPFSGGLLDTAKVTLNDLDLHEITAIRAQISQEVETSIVRDEIDHEEFGPRRGNLPAMESHEDRGTTELAELKKTLPSLNSRLQEDALRASKLERKMGLVLGGYENRSKMLSTKLLEAANALQQAYIDHATFEALQTNESAAIITRKEVLQEEVRLLEQHQANGQARYSALSARKDELMSNMII